MRTLAVLLLVLCGCPEKKAAPKPVEPAAEGSSAHSPVLQPVENKLDNAMQKNENRAAPDPE